MKFLKTTRTTRTLHTPRRDRRRKVQAAFLPTTHRTRGSTYIPCKYSSTYSMYIVRGRAAAIRTKHDVQTYCRGMRAFSARRGFPDYYISPPCSTRSLGVDTSTAHCEEVWLHKRLQYQHQIMQCGASPATVVQVYSDPLDHSCITHRSLTYHSHITHISLTYYSQITHKSLTDHPQITHRSLRSSTDHSQITHK